MTCFLPHTHSALKWPAPPLKRARRTATSVLSGAFDPRPRVDVLTSLLNGVKPYRPPLTEEEIREKEAAKEKRKQHAQMMAEERERKKKEKAEKRATEKLRLQEQGRTTESCRRDGSHGSSAGGSGRSKEDRPNSFWQALPSKHSIDISTTPEASDDESLFSGSSSKRLQTPFDDESISSAPMSPQWQPAPVKRKRSPGHRGPGRPPKKRRAEDVKGVPKAVPSHTTEPKPAKKRTATRKGWKGWVEAEEEELPRDKLIELDTATILQDRRTRSGKSFDAIGEGKDTWV